MISGKEWLDFCHENVVMRGVESVHEEKRTCYYCHGDFLSDPYTDCTPQYCSPECKRRDEEEYRKEGHTHSRFNTTVDLDGHSEESKCPVCGPRLKQEWENFRKRHGDMVVGGRP